MLVGQQRPLFGLGIDECVFYADDAIQTAVIKVKKFQLGPTADSRTFVYIWIRCVGQSQPIERPFSLPGIYLGTSSFTGAGWEGSLYPIGMLSKDFLRHNASFKPSRSTARFTAFPLLRRSNSSRIYGTKIGIDLCCKIRLTALSILRSTSCFTSIGLCPPAKAADNTQTSLR